MIGDKTLEDKGKIRDKDKVVSGKYVAIIIILLSLCILITISRVLIAGKTVGEKEKLPNYSRRYAFLIEDMTDDFMLNVYKSAKDKAAEDGIYVELVGSNLSAEYSMNDYLNMAIASKPDGIILESDGTKDTRELIKKATDSGIPVITVMSDSFNSTRKCFVGPNYYDLGKKYGIESYVLNTDKSERFDIKMLLRDTTSENDRNSIYQGVMSELNRKPGRYQLDIVMIHSEDALSMEEDIRNLIYNDESGTDVYIAMDPAVTKFAYQALVDYNRLSGVKFIGYYTTESILQAIQNGTVDSTISMDADEIGVVSVDALTEYIDNGFVSSYIPVETHLIDALNVNEKLMEKDGKK